jgi:plastocyanin
MRTSPVFPASYPTRPAGALALAAAVAVLLAACGGGGSSPSASSAPPGGSTMTSAAPSSAGASMAAAAVHIKDFAFAPASQTVKAGETVTWTNDDSTEHTVTADDGSFDSGRLAPGATFTHTFAAAGTFAYHCTIHPNMTAKVVVQ